MRISLPAVTTSVAPVPPSERPPPTLDPSLRPRLLIVDDEPRLAWTLKIALGGRYDVVIAESGLAALETLEELAAARASLYRFDFTLEKPEPDVGDGDWESWRVVRAAFRPANIDDFR